MTGWTDAQVAVVAALASFSLVLAALVLIYGG